MQLHDLVDMQPIIGSKLWQKDINKKQWKTLVENWHGLGFVNKLK